MAVTCDLRIEARRGGDRLASTEPSGPRLDITGDPALRTAFTLDCSDVATTDELLDGGVVIVAVDGDADADADAAGREKPLEFFAPVRERAVQDLVTARLRPLDAASAPTPAAAGPSGESRRPQAARQPRIVFIGAGSTVFAQNLLGDILSEPALSVSQICLHDIDPDRLRTSAAVAARIVQALGVRAEIQ